MRKVIVTIYNLDGSKEVFEPHDIFYTTSLGLNLVWRFKNDVPNMENYDKEKEMYVLPSQVNKIVVETDYKELQ